MNPGNRVVWWSRGKGCVHTPLRIASGAQNSRGNAPYGLFKRILIATLLIGAINLAGCLPSPTLAPSIKETTTPEPSLTPSPTLNPTLTRTARPTATATRVPLPTLPPAEALGKVQEFLETNGGCAFPCWWGITPGETTWNEVLDTLQPIAWRMSNIKNHRVYKERITREFYFARDDQPTLINSLMVIFVLEKATMEIEWIVAGQSYNLEELLLDYGVPEEIWVTANGLPISGPVDYTIQLFYPNKGILAGMSSNTEMVHKLNEDFANVCKKALIEDSAGILFWSPDMEIEHQEFFIEYERINEFLPIQTAANMTPEDFYNLVLSGGLGDCIEIPMRNWDK